MSESITIIVTTYNSESCIAECLSSIPTQIFNLDVCVLVSDDCSTDRTLDIVHGFSSHKSIDVLTSKSNFGVGANRNRALSHVKTSYFMFLDSDDLFVDHSSSQTNSLPGYGTELAPDMLLLARQIPMRQKLQLDLEQAFSSAAQYPNISDISSMLSVLNEQKTLFGECWGIIFKSNLAARKSVSFPEVRLFEDMAFLSSYLLAAGSWSFSNLYAISKSTGIGLSRVANSSSLASTCVAHDFVCDLFADRSTIPVHSGLDEYLIRVIRCMSREIGFLQYLPLASFDKSSIMFSQYSSNAFQSSLISESKKIFNRTHSLLESALVKLCSRASQGDHLCIWFATPLSIVLARHLACRGYSILCFLDDNRSGNLIDCEEAGLVNVKSLESLDMVASRHALTFAVFAPNDLLIDNIVQRSRAFVPTAEFVCCCV